MRVFFFFVQFIHSKNLRICQAGIYSLLNLLIVFVQSKFRTVQLYNPKNLSAVSEFHLINFNLLEKFVFEGLIPCNQPSISWNLNVRSIIHAFEKKSCYSQIKNRSILSNLYFVFV